MTIDKYQSKQKYYRVPEKQLFLLAFIFGALGIYLAMKFPLYHKANKRKFKFTIPFLVVLNAIIVWYLFKNMPYFTFNQAKV